MLEVMALFNGEASMPPIRAPDPPQARPPGRLANDHQTILKEMYGVELDAAHEQLSCKSRATVKV